MKTVIHLKVLSLAVALLSTVSMYGQGGEPEGPRNQAGPQNEGRPNLLRQLGLNTQQVRQIRQYNVRRRPMMEAAQRRFREANRRLDEAIYADQLNEVEINERIKEVQLSQADLIRIRSMSELSIRKILTPEQLVRFRRLRQRFDEASSRPGRQAFAMPATDDQLLMRLARDR